MRHIRLTRMVATAAMLGSLVGGAVLATAGPASAAAGGVVNCTSLTGGGDISAFPPIVTGPISGCSSHSGGTLTAIVDISGGIAPGSIAWNTGHATTLITIQVINIDFSGGTCPAGDVAATVLIVATAGPNAGTSSVGTLCADISGGLTAVVFSLAPGTVFTV
jgi:hypothetical protein